MSPYWNLLIHKDLFKRTIFVDLYKTHNKDSILLVTLVDHYM